eukprot:scaffold336970_cov38-Prasinocladus_malaysianus.AAC.2
MADICSGKNALMRNAATRGPSILDSARLHFHHCKDCMLPILSSTHRIQLTSYSYPATSEAHFFGMAY